MGGDETHEDHGGRNHRGVRSERGPRGFGEVINKTYLAMGDSQAFGYSEETFNREAPLEPAAAFSGYVDDYFTLLHPSLIHMQLVNVSCPGETTESLIGSGPLATALGVSGEAPCAYSATDGLPLHTAYGAGRSQLETAIEKIATESPGTPVQKVTINIGFNDVLHTFARCEAEVAAEYAAHGSSNYAPMGSIAQAVSACDVAQAPALVSLIVSNIGKIVFALRNGATFGGINYTGEIDVLQSYDPFGDVWGTSAFAAALVSVIDSPNGFPWLHATTGELLGGSNVLIQKLSAEEVNPSNGLTSSTPICFANPQPTFNPGGTAEQNRLQNWTNMANTSTTNGLHDGPDIHPTPTGYKQLATLINQQCP